MVCREARVLLLVAILSAARACFIVPLCDCSQNFNGLTMLDCSNRQLPSVPNINVQNNRVYSIDLSSNSIGRLPSWWFANFSSLQVITVLGNPIGSIADDTFAGTAVGSLSISFATSGVGGTGPAFNWTILTPVAPSVTNLTVSGFSAKSLPPNCVGNATNLRYLSLSNNQINTIVNSSFAGLGNLTWLDLSLNTLSTIPRGALTALSSLKTLILANNQIWTVAPLSIPLPNLVYLDLSRNLVQQVQSNAFVSNLATLQYLDLTKNRLSDSSVAGLNGFIALQTLKLGQNQFVIIGNVLNQCCQRSQLQYLDISQNLITQLSANTFTYAADSLSSLILDENSYLTAIDANTFASLQNLTYLQANSIQLFNILQLSPTIFSGAPLLSQSLRSLYLDDTSLSSAQLPAFSTLTQLTTLSLQYNVIDSIPAMIFSQFPQLQTLQLGNNQISSLDGVAVYGLRSLQTLDLSSNPLSAIPNCVIMWLPSLQVLELVGVPLSCDCNLLWLKQWTTAQVQSGSSNVQFISNYVCASPPWSVNKNLIKVPPANFTCLVNQIYQSSSSCVDIDALLLQNFTFPFSVQVLQTNITITIPTLDPYTSLVASVSAVATNLVTNQSLKGSSAKPAANTTVILTVQQSGVYNVSVVLFTAQDTMVVASSGTKIDVRLPEHVPVASASLVAIIVPAVCGVALVLLGVLILLLCLRRRRAARRSQGDPFKKGRINTKDLSHIDESGTRYTKRTNANGENSRMLGDESVGTLLGDPHPSTTVLRGHAIYENSVAMASNRQRMSSVVSDGRAMSMNSLLDDSKGTLYRNAPLAHSTTTIDTHESIPLPRRPRFAPGPARMSQDRPDTTYEELPDDIPYANVRVSRRESARTKSNPPRLPIAERLSPSLAEEPANDAHGDADDENHRPQTWNQTPVNATQASAKPDADAQLALRLS